MSERPGSRTEHVRLHTRQLRQQEVSELTASGFSTKGAGLKRENLESDVKFLPRPCWRDIFGVAPWLRLRPAKLAPILAGTNNCRNTRKYCGKRGNQACR